MWRGFFLILCSLFVIRNCSYFLGKCGVLNEILEPAIFIFKSNTNKASINIDVEFHNTNLILSIIKMPSNVSVS